MSSVRSLDFLAFKNRCNCINRFRVPSVLVAYEVQPYGMTVDSVVKLIPAFLYDDVSLLCCLDHRWQIHGIRRIDRCEHAALDRSMREIVCIEHRFKTLPFVPNVTPQSIKILLLQRMQRKLLIEDGTAQVICFAFCNVPDQIWRPSEETQT